MPCTLSDQSVIFLIFSWAPLWNNNRSKQSCKMTVRLLLCARVCGILCVLLCVLCPVLFYWFAAATGDVWNYVLCILHTLCAISVCLCVAEKCSATSTSSLLVRFCSELLLHISLAGCHSFCAVFHAAAGLFGCIVIFWLHIRMSTLAAASPNRHMIDMCITLQCVTVVYSKE